MRVPVIKSDRKGCFSNLLDYISLLKMTGLLPLPEDKYVLPSGISVLFSKKSYEDC